MNTDDGIPVRGDDAATDHAKSSLKSPRGREPRVPNKVLHQPVVCRICRLRDYLIGFAVALQPGLIDSKQVVPILPDVLIAFDDNRVIGEVLCDCVENRIDLSLGLRFAQALAVSDEDSPAESVLKGDA